MATKAEIDDYLKGLQLTADSLKVLGIEPDIDLRYRLAFPETSIDLDTRYLLQINDQNWLHDLMAMALERDGPITETDVGGPLVDPRTEDADLLF